MNEPETKARAVEGKIAKDGRSMHDAALPGTGMRELESVKGSLSAGAERDGRKVPMIKRAKDEQGRGEAQGE